MADLADGKAACSWGHGMQDVAITWLHENDEGPFTPNLRVRHVFAEMEGVRRMGGPCRQACLSVLRLPAVC